MLEMKLQYFDHVMQRADSFEKTLMLRKIAGRRRRGWGWQEEDTLTKGAGKTGQPLVKE